MEFRNVKININELEKKEEILDLMVEKTIDNISNYLDNHKSVDIGILIAIGIVLMMILIKKTF